MRLESLLDSFHVCTLSIHTHTCRIRFRISVRGCLNGYSVGESHHTAEFTLRGQGKPVQMR